MQVLIVCMVLFFGATELYQWVENTPLPMTVWVAGGVALAIVSNLRSSAFLSWSGLADRQAPTDDIAKSIAAPSAETVSPAPIVSAPPRYYPGVQLPNLNPQVQPPISFTLSQTSDRQPSTPEEQA